MNPEVRRVPSRATHDLILTKHYAQRLPPISHAFGYFEHGRMVGALTIGKPASHNLCVGLAGPHWSSNVYELNRLIVDGDIYPNALSFFVGKAMKQLAETDLVLVSYADEGAGHHGYIYIRRPTGCTPVKPSRAPINTPLRVSTPGTTRTSTCTYGRCEAPSTGTCMSPTGDYVSGSSAT